ncbi:hypothetical protein V5N11_005505 [Cardamine amara subsp. amara]|uniref:MI domain-containing protein n=1 Tax=Cardamine amara subsp. amara TaxID=228776 RepID=A0ABD1AGU3_CARAN
MDRHDGFEKERRHSDHYKKREEESEVVKPKVTQLNQSDYNIMALGKSGGAYILPFKQEPMMKKKEDDTSTVEYQYRTWDALSQSINGLVNKVNASNIKNIISELFAENIIRGRGLFCSSCINSQMSSPESTDVFAALVSVVNSKLPQVGQLLLKRLVLQLLGAFTRKDKPQVLATVKFIAHLVNQQVTEVIIALELVSLLLKYPSDDSVEVAVVFVKECGVMLQDVTPKILHEIFEVFRRILHEGDIDKRTQCLIEDLLVKFTRHPAIRLELDLVEEKYSHHISLDQEIDPETSLDVFKPDPNFLENEKKYEAIKTKLLSEDHEDGSNARVVTNTNLYNLLRTIYQIIISTDDFEEACHKLLKINLKPGQEMELCIMLLECCSQERTYRCFYGLLGQRLCKISKIHLDNFERCFVLQCTMIHHLETNKLRNRAKFFAHLLTTEALPWNLFCYITFSEENTTSSARIFIKFLFEALSEYLGITLLNERLNGLTMKESIFPKDNSENMERLIIMPQENQVAESESGSSSESESFGSESVFKTGSSSSDSETGSCHSSSSGAESESSSSNSKSGSSVSSDSTSGSSPSSSLDGSHREKRKSEEEALD